MTLTEVLPSIAGSLHTKLEPDVWPRSACAGPDGLSIAGISVNELAARFGTPAYILDEDEVRRRCLDYRVALPDFEIAYAGKALMCRAVLRLMAEQGFSLDVCSAGEVAAARAAGFPAERILLHGNAKTSEDWKAALGYQVGRIVVDSLDEIQQLGSLARYPQRVLIRVTPGVDGHTHKAIATGVEDQKFGFSLRSGAAMAAVDAVLAQPGLRLAGLHCHIGSQVASVAGYELAARRMVEFIGRIRDRHGVVVGSLDLGGGHAVPYLPGEQEFDLTGYAQRVRVAVNYTASALGIPALKLTIEPGRALVANAGVTLYRVVTVKGPYVAVDGGMSDNMRVALYGARYLVRLAGRPSGAPIRTVSVVGRHCEAGDVLATDVPLPSDVRPGDVLAVPVTGAYHHSLASNYNQVCRPPIIGVRDGFARPLVRRETEEDLLARDVG
ncbi:diaminopimelate decarboxylase [Kibdelosporangium banguiense]|uniref:Diaminopimelate decarboxylase n=1 Tax=Kibdelosporangium banguiense TaxID=1365924 RepID=A0ABS4TCN3_9PSEU|nr:diaminopimelate decarboxylase [Kibdelosporangium banguiense]MBP2322186.1 diaminopimelate decarboxylase [Kibdelosporangium banguiense]